MSGDSERVNGKRRIGEHLKKHGYITPMVHFAVYGKMNGLPQRVRDLRESGWSIETKLYIDDAGKTYPKYILRGAPDNEPT